MEKRVSPLVKISDSRKVDVFLQNGLSNHYRSSHRQSEFIESDTGKRGIELVRELVTSGNVGNPQKLSHVKRTNLSVFYFSGIKLFFITD